MMLRPCLTAMPLQKTKKGQKKKMDLQLAADGE